MPARRRPPPLPELNVSADLRTARRCILNAIRTGKEHDLYEGLSVPLNHPCRAANGEHPELRAYSCGPQGSITVSGTVKLRDRDTLTDSNYEFSPQPARDAVGSGEASILTRRRSQDGFGDDDAHERAPGFDLAARRSKDSVPVSDDLEDPGYLTPSTASLHTSMTTHLNSPFNASTNSSAEIFYGRKRIPDYRISMAYLNDEDEEISRYIVAVIEVKLCSPSLNNASTRPASYQQQANRMFEDMMPQVIQSVQLVFAKSDQDEVVAIPIVNEFCRFLYFKCTDVPPMDPATVMDDVRGFRDPDGRLGADLVSKYVFKATVAVQMINGVRSTMEEMWKSGTKVKFGDTFLGHWYDFIDWTRRTELFPDPLDRESQA